MDCIVLSEEAAEGGFREYSPALIFSGVRIQPIWETIIFSSDLDALYCISSTIELGFIPRTKGVYAPFVGNRVCTGRGEGKDW